jgi:CheY-like chemotaxis protein
MIETVEAPATQRPEQTARAKRPVMLAVDDEPGVLRAVERDLRRHFSADYRVLRAESGAEALEILDELGRRGEDVALLLADQRMPQMDGVQFCAPRPSATRTRARCS